MVGDRNNRKIGWYFTWMVMRAHWISVESPHRFMSKKLLHGNILILIVIINMPSSDATQ